MSERVFRIVLGLLLVIGLSFDLTGPMWGLVGVLVFEGITNWRVVHIVSRLRYGPSYVMPRCCANAPNLPPSRINFEAERTLPLIVAALVSASHGSAPLWFIPWFMGFALLGAGLSGICPMVIGLRWLGFR